MKTFRDLPKDGETGEWKFSISDSGYSNRDVMLEVVEDLDNYIIEKQIPKPVILLMDGFKGHYGIEINEECDKRGVQLWCKFVYFFTSMDLLTMNLVLNDTFFF